MAKKQPQNVHTATRWGVSEWGLLWGHLVLKTFFLLQNQKKKKCGATFIRAMGSFHIDTSMFIILMSNCWRWNPIIYAELCLLKYLAITGCLINVVWIKNICQNVYNKTLTLYNLNNTWLWKRGHIIKFKYRNLSLEILIVISAIFTQLRILPECLWKFDGRSSENN